MKIEYRIGLYTLGILIIILLSIYTGDLLYLTKVPAVAPFGFIILIFLAFMDAFLVMCEGKSPQVITNVGHWSINITKDMFDIPWQVESSDERTKGLNLLSLRIALVGGIDYWGISLHSSSEKPIVIAPAIYFHKEEKNYTCYANLERYEIEGLPIYIQYILKKHFPNRIKDKTPIYYSEVSHIDGSATPENMKIIHMQRDQNKEDSVFEKRIIRLYDEMKRGEKAKNRIFFKKDVEEMEDESER